MTDDDLDRQLEVAADSDAASVERVVAAALDASPPRRLTAGRVAASAGVLGLIVGAIALGWTAWPRPEAAVRISNVGDVIIVEYPDGSRSILGPARPERELFAGYNYVIVEGERK